MIIFFIVIGLPGLIVFIHFIGFIVKGKQVVNKVLIWLAELGSLFILPYSYAGFGQDNLCCMDEIDTAAFSPKHQLTIAAIILLSLAGYIYSKFRSDITTPVIEVLVNVFIIIGIILNIFIAFHTRELLYATFGNLPVILLGILMLVKNQKLFLQNSEQKRNAPLNKMEVFAWNILSSRYMLKFPILVILCLPVLVLVTSILLIFGQKPDSIIRAFTDTYKHGFSQWDFKCDNVQCGGHYLCSVAAKGHKQIVKPQRFGIRSGGKIICNRQLLISNAFEDLIQEKIPFIHKVLRMYYDGVGHFIHRYYHIFDIKILSDIIYILMKPLEWFFLLALYTFDKKPENRIAKQYMHRSDRNLIEQSECGAQNLVVSQFKI